MDLGLGRIRLWHHQPERRLAHCREPQHVRDRKSTLEVVLSNGGYPVSMKQTFLDFSQSTHGVGEANYPGDSLPLNPLKHLRDGFDFHTHG